MNSQPIIFKGFRYVFSATFTAVVLLWTGIAAAELYKYTDENGRVVYSDKLPVTGQPIEASPASGNTPNIQTLQTTQSPEPEAVQRLRQGEADFQKRMQERAASESKALEERKAQEQHAKFCSDVHNALNQYQSSRPLYRVDANNKRVNVSTDERQREIARLQEMLTQQKCQ